MDITSKHNEKYKFWLSLKETKMRKEHQAFLVEGKHLVEEALRRGILSCLLVREGIAGLDEVVSYHLSSALFDKLCDTVSKEDWIGVCRSFEVSEHAWQRVIVADGIQDAGNLGNMIRTAYSFGFDALILTEGSISWHHPKVIRATQGALFHLPVYEMKRQAIIMQCKELQLEMFVTSLNQSQPLGELKPADKMLFVMGSEGQGVHQDFFDAPHRSVRIEMNDFDSLNVAVAAGILMYRFRQLNG